MNTAVINIKTDKELKIKAHEVASELGLSLSAILNAYMRQLIRTRSVYFDATTEQPSDYLLNALKASEAERKKGKNSPVFSTSKDALAWLKKSK